MQEGVILNNHTSGSDMSLLHKIIRPAFCRNIIAGLRLFQEGCTEREAKGETFQDWRKIQEEDERAGTARQWADSAACVTAVSLCRSYQARVSCAQSIQAMNQHSIKLSTVIIGLSMAYARISFSNTLSCNPVHGLLLIYGYQRAVYG